MKASRYMKRQIIGVMKEADAGVTVRGTHVARL